MSGWGEVRYIVHGAGAVGGVVGACLFEAGADVLLVARGAHLEALQANGLRFGTYEGERTLAIPVVGHVSEIGFGGDDVVLLTTKTQSTEQALIEIEAAGGGDLPIFCGQNGVENERLAMRRFARVYGVYVRAYATHIGPGSVSASARPTLAVFDPGIFPYGEDRLARQLAADLASAQISSSPRADISRWKYGKLLSSLRAALLAICGPEEDTRELQSLLREEGERVLTAAGIEFVTEQQQAARLLEANMNATGSWGGSTWQSLVRKAGNVETDYLNGEIVLLGRLHGVATPYNAAVRELANRLARQGGDPGRVSVDDVHGHALRHADR